MSNEPVAWLYTAAHEPWNRHLEWVENASGYRGDWIKTPLSDRDDTALLRQALEALENLGRFDSRPSSIWTYFYASAKGDFVNLREFREKAEPAITALRERLKGKA